MFRQIIVGLDGSEKAKKGARVAYDLGKYYSGHVTLVHVQPAESEAIALGSEFEYHAETRQPSFDQAEAAVQKIFEDALKIASDVAFDAINTFISHGDIATEILLHADEIDADLIITGRRGLSGISGLVWGSTTQNVNHRAKCACLSVV